MQSFLEILELKDKPFAVYPSIPNSKHRHFRQLKMYQPIFVCIKNQGSNALVVTVEQFVLEYFEKKDSRINRDQNAPSIEPWQTAISSISKTQSIAYPHILIAPF